MTTQPKIKATPVTMPCPMPATPEGLRGLLQHVLNSALDAASDKTTGFSIMVVIETPDESGPHSRACMLHGGEIHPAVTANWLIESLRANGALDALDRDVSAGLAALGPKATATARENGPAPHTVH